MIRKMLLFLTGWLIIAVLPVHTQGLDQALTLKEDSINFKKEIPLEKQLNILENEYGINFLYQSSLVKGRSVEEVNSNDKELTKVLNKLLPPLQLSYDRISKKDIVLLSAESKQPINDETVTGKVTEAGTGNILPGVNILVKGTNIGTTSDEDGEFELMVPSLQDTLIFSFVGFQTKEVPLEGRNELEISLQAQAITGEEMVVIGYGSQKEENLTSSVSTVDVDEVLESRPITDVTKGLQGAVPGLSIVDADPEVGSSAITKIRGQVGSISGSSNPLILVDNVEVPSIQYVNPNNIKSISVLKDASATSIYGSKAAFGVILITTKDGADTEGTEITYSNNFNWQTPFKDIEIAGIDGAEYTLEAHENMDGSGPAGGFWRINRESFERMKEWQDKYGDKVGTYDPVVYNRDWYFDGSDKFGLRMYDPAEVMIKDVSFSQKHNIGINGKVENTRYNLNIGYLGQNGMMKPAEHDDYRRITGDLKISTEVTDYLTIRGGAKYADAVKRHPESLTGYVADPWLYVYRWSRLFPTGVKELGEEIRDPYWSTKNANTAKERNKYLNLDAGATVDIMDNWDFQIDYAFSNELKPETRSQPTWDAKLHWYTPTAWVEDGLQVYVDEEGNKTESGGVPAYRFPMSEVSGENDSYYYMYSYESQRHSVNAYSNYELDINQDHNVKAMVGMDVEAFSWKSHSSRNTNLINNDNPQFNFAIGDETVGGGTNWNSQFGVFSRVNYAYKDKYLLEGNIRYDGTSKFTSDLRWRWYPSFSAGWVLTNEKFMEALDPILSWAKIRGSWGIIGDQSVSNSLYLATMSIGKNNWLSSNGEQYFQMGTPNPISAGITWQDIEQLDIGTDLRFLDNKLEVTFDWYQRYTKNMIIPGDALPATYGASAPRGNYGDLRTRGWEIEAGYDFHFENDLNISVNFNLSDAKTMITKGPDYKTDWENRSIHNTWTTGKKYGDIYGYVTDRLYQKDDFVYDSNGDIEQTTIVIDGDAKRTNKLSGDNPVYQTYFEDGNQILLNSPGDPKYVDVDGDGYITPGKNTFGDPGDQVVIGNSTPRYQYGFRVDANYKSFDFSIFLQGVGKRDIWGSGQLAIPGYYAKEGAMPQAIAGDFWKEDRTDAFYPRAWNNGGANTGFNMKRQSKYLLDMSYLKIKNITVGYSLPKHIVERINLKRARFYVSIEDWFTFDNLRGLPIDPEAISGYSMLGSNYNLGRTGTSTPPFKSASLGVQVSL